MLSNPKQEVEGPGIQLQTGVGEVVEASGAMFGMAGHRWLDYHHCLEVIMVLLVVLEVDVEEDGRSKKVAVDLKEVVEEVGLVATVPAHVVWEGEAQS